MSTKLGYVTKTDRFLGQILYIYVALQIWIKVTEIKELI